MLLYPFYETAVRNENVKPGIESEKPTKDRWETDLKLDRKQQNTSRPREGALIRDIPKPAIRHRLALAALDLGHLHNVL